jgi:hypothetical protein
VGGEELTMEEEDRGGVLGLRLLEGERGGWWRERRERRERGREGEGEREKARGRDGQLGRLE